jgi:predicted nucleotidyltransferase
MVSYTLKEKILKFLIENKENPHSIREISQKLEADYKNTYQALAKINYKTYSKTKQGNSYLIEFNQDNNIETLSLEEKRTKEFFSKNLSLKVIKKYVRELNYPFLIVLVFGSYIKKTNTNNSDIDMCIILDNESKSKILNEKLSLLSLNLELQEFTSKEFTSMIKKKQNNLGNEIIKNNIILYGKENYYNLISKWTKKE